MFHEDDDLSKYLHQMNSVFEVGTDRRYDKYVRYGEDQSIGFSAFPSMAKLVSLLVELVHVLLCHRVALLHY